MGICGNSRSTRKQHKQKQHKAKTEGKNREKNSLFLTRKSENNSEHERVEKHTELVGLTEGVLPHGGPHDRPRHVHHLQGVPPGAEPLNMSRAKNPQRIGCTNLTTTSTTSSTRHNHPACYPHHKRPPPAGLCHHCHHCACRGRIIECVGGEKSPKNGVY